MVEGQSSEPPSASRPRRRLGLAIVLWVVGVAVAIAVVITGAYYLDAAVESDSFCGPLCHATRPDGIAHQVTPHADVECVKCHVGPGLFPKVLVKIYGMGELYHEVTNTYPRPLTHPVPRLRPASEICGQCHAPEQTFGQRLRTISTFAPDETNSETQMQLLLRVDARTMTPGQGTQSVRPGAHWHVANPVWYVARDAVRQDIPWVGVPGADGQLTSFESRNNALSAQELQALPLRKMDCLDCHNRPAHLFRQPERLVDEDLAQGTLDPSLPFLKREASKLLAASYPTQSVGEAAMAGLRDFYRASYSTTYDSMAQSIDGAVTELQSIYQQTTFPEMNLTWQSYPNNAGHADFVGCFRCHDGQHLNDRGEPIPLRCNLCHSLPAVAAAGSSELAQALKTIAAGVNEPGSHRQPGFFTSHFSLVSDSCTSCHGQIMYGSDGSNFCANPACHGRSWPGINLKGNFVHPVPLVFQHAQVACQDCHKAGRPPDINQCGACHQPPNQPHFGTDCARCHTPQGFQLAAATWLNDAPAIPHRIPETPACVDCHAAGKSVPFPASHRGIPATACTQCHKPGQVAAGPTIAHPVQGRENCLSCHGVGALRPVPADHDGWDSGTCQLCHTQS